MFVLKQLILLMFCFWAVQIQDVQTRPSDEYMEADEAQPERIGDEYSVEQSNSDEPVIENVIPDRRSSFSRAAGGAGKNNGDAGATKANSANAKTGHPMDFTPAFSDWSSWSTKYPGCNPESNKFLSPIKIDTKKATRDKTTPTLFVYSNTPISDYILSTEFHGDPEYNMTALTITLAGSQRHEATYVTGVGDTSYRFFMYALFMFSKSNQNSKLSLHQIDDTTFPMEILMYFSTTRTEDDTTQVLVMVNISQIENPLFVPVVTAAKKIADRVTNARENKDKTDSQLEKVERMRKKLNDEVQQRKSSGFYTIVEKLKASSDEIKSYDSSIKYATGEIETLKKIIGEANTAVENYDSAIKSSTDTLTKLENNIAELKKTAGSASGEELNQINNQLSKLISEVNTISKTLDEYGNKRQESDGTRKAADTKLGGLEKTLKEHEEKLAKIIADVGLAGKKVSDVEEYIKDADKILADERKAKGDLYKENTLYQQYKNELSLTVGLKIFQVSWLLPAFGGHYIYDGSLPVPPCTRRGFTLVLENAVSISQEQFDAIAAIGDIPAFIQMKESLPVLAEVGDRKVRYNKKNLQYILDDAVHMKSKLRKKIKDKMRDNQCNSIIGSNFLIVANTSLLMLVLYLRT